MEITPPPKKKKSTLRLCYFTSREKVATSQVKAMENSIIISGCY